VSLGVRGEKRLNTPGLDDMSSFTRTRISEYIVTDFVANSEHAF
jgi:hypothetical protein